METTLKAALDRTLVASVPDSLKAACDRLLARGMSKLSVMTAVKGFALKAANGDTNKCSLTIAAVEAYLETK